MKIGELEIHLISDGTVRVDAGGPYGLVPRALYRSHQLPDEHNTVVEGLNSLLIRSAGLTILVDTGLGIQPSEKMRKIWRLQRPQGSLLDGLKRLGVAPQDVDLVINTHLHADHCSANLMQGDEEGSPTFPKARYLVQRLEWADATHPDARTRGTYFAQNFQPLWKTGQLSLVHGDVQITKHVRCVVTPGHTRAHQAVLLSEQGWQGLYVSDMATFTVHLTNSAWMTAFDVLPLESIRTKRRWQRWALERDAWLMFLHDPILPVGRLVMQDGRLQMSSIPEAETLIDLLPTQPPLRE